MDYRTAAKEIAKGTIHTNYLCYGSEQFLLHEFLSFLIEKTIEPGHRDFALSRFDLSEVPVETVIEDAETPPFMVPRKIIIARNALFFSSSKDSAKIEHDLSRLLDYADSPVDYTTIVFTLDAEKLDERKKIVKVLKDKGRVIPFTAFSPQELVKWVEKQAEKHNFRFADQAVEALIMHAGTGLQNLAAEIAKLSLYAGREGMATKDMIEELVVRSTEQNIFMLIEDAVKLRLDKALFTLAELIKQREEPIKILMLMARQFRMMLQTKELKQKGFSQQQIASQIGAHPYAVKMADEQAAKYDLTRLRQILSELAELDFRMKSGKIDKSLGLELFLLRLAG